MFDYQVEAAVTESPQFRGELVKASELINCISACIYNLRRLDKYKKTLFYGKEGAITRDLPEGADATKIPAYFASPNSSGGSAPNSPIDEAQAIRLIHGIVGVATEACELLELLLAGIEGTKSFDFVNLDEECGDVFWYIACCLNTIGISFDGSQRRNIAKLRKRFPNKFTEFDAINRDTDAERTVLTDGYSTSEIVSNIGFKVETDAGMLQRLGTNGDLWAQEYLNHTVLKKNPFDFDTLRAWFTNSIEAGKADEHRKVEKKFFDIRNVTDVACLPGNANASDYMRGMANGLILAQSIVDGVEPKYIAAPTLALAKPDNSKEAVEGFVSGIPTDEHPLN